MIVELCVVSTYMSTPPTMTTTTSSSSAAALVLALPDVLLHHFVSYLGEWSEFQSIDRPFIAFHSREHDYLFSLYHPAPPPLCLIGLHGVWYGMVWLWAWIGWGCGGGGGGVTSSLGWRDHGMTS